MAFTILRQLQYCSGSDYGNNFNNPPSRIIPISLIEDYENKSNSPIIKYIPPRLGNEYILCENGKKLPEPSAYFKSPNTLLKSLLYISNIEYHNNVIYPKKANDILQKYLSTIFEKYTKSVKEKSSYKKLVQVILNNTNGAFDTDPNKNPYFVKFINAILKYEKCNIIIIREDDNGNFLDTVPNKIPSLDLVKNENVYYIILQNSNGLYSPYGKAYKNIKND